MEWLGEIIPNNWRTARIKEFLAERKELCDNDCNLDLLSVSEYYGVAKRKNIIKDTDILSRAESVEGYKICHPGDLVMNIMLAWKRATGYCGEDGITSPAYAVYRPTGDICMKYFHYLFRTDIYAKYFENNSTGIIPSRYRLYPDVFLGLRCHYPPYEIQSRIASFLDSHIAKIDDSIARYKALSDKLDEYRYNVISKITCVGIREKKLFTPLNNEFLDRLPKDWEYKRLKFTSVEIFKGDGITKDEVDVNGNIPCIRYGEIYSKYDIACSKCYSLTNLEAHTSPKYAVYGDLLFAGTGELIEDIGKNIVYLGSQPCLVGGDIIVVRHNQNPKFLSYALNSHYARAQKSKGKSKLKVVHISALEIGNIRVAIPPLDEQAEIVAYLDKKCSDIDSSKEKIETVIKRLEEYKKSLIYNAVTGKIEC